MIENKDDVTGCILGAKGSGKSVLLAYMANITSNKRVILFDMLGVYNPRKKYKTAIVPNSYYCETPGAFYNKVETFPKKAKIVIDFSGFIGEALISEIDKVCTVIMEQEIPTSVLSDEVADFMPQNGKTSERFHLLVKNGRNYGINPVEFATQRPQSVDKSVFDLCDNFYISMQRAPRTIEYIVDLIDQKGNKEMHKNIATLPQGTFLKYDGVSLKRQEVGRYPYAFKQ